MDITVNDDSLAKIQPFNILPRQLLSFYLKDLNL
jgi:hypothetical protein